MSTTTFKPADAVMHAPPFLSSDDVLEFLKNSTMSVLNCHPVKNPSHVLKIKNQFFDFSEVNSFARKEIITLHGEGSVQIIFKKCIFVGGIKFSNCILEHINFENCQFIDPENWIGRKPDGVLSISLHDITGTRLTIEKCILENPIEVFGRAPESILISKVIAPQVWLQSMGASNSMLNVINFSGGGIHLPDGEQKFESGKIYSDDWSLRHFWKTRQSISVTKNKD